MSQVFTWSIFIMFMLLLMVHIQAENIIKKTLQIANIWFINPLRSHHWSILNPVWDFLFVPWLSGFQRSIFKRQKTITLICDSGLFPPFSMFPYSFPRSGAVREFGGQTRNILQPKMKNQSKTRKWSFDGMQTLDLWVEVFSFLAPHLPPIMFASSLL